MIEEKMVEHIEANLATTFTATLHCQKKLPGCQHSLELEYENAVMPATAAEGFYQEGWRVKQVEGQAVIFCSNCDYQDK